MRIQRYGHTVELWLSARDTYNWAHKSGAAWPCSTISGQRLFAEFHGGDLIDVAVNSGRGSQDIDGHEFSAITQDFLNGVA